MDRNGATWEEEAETRLRYAREQKKRAEQDIAYWSRYAEALETVLELDREYNPPTTNGYPATLVYKSVREAIIEIAKRNGGLLVTRDAAQILVNSGKFVDRNEASTNIFSTLSHNKRIFEKEARGIYRLVDRMELF